MGHYLAMFMVLRQWLTFQRVFEDTDTRENDENHSTLGKVILSIVLFPSLSLKRQEGDKYILSHTRFTSRGDWGTMEHFFS